MGALRRLLNNLYWFFPVYLLILHLRRSLLLVAFWLVLFGMVGGQLFYSIGIPFLFQTPEYMGEVNALSYLITGSFLGLFIMAFHVSSYLFYSFRFPFLATLARPLYRFSINNSLLPVAFIAFYSYTIAISAQQEGFGFWESMFFILALNGGVILTLSLVFSYFFSTLKKTPLQTVSEKIERSTFAFWRKKSDQEMELETVSRVRIYLKNFFVLRRARSTDHYSVNEISETLQQHRNQAGVFFLLLLLIFTSLSLASNIPLLRIPAASSIILLFTVYLLVTGALFSWLKTWTYTVGIVVVILLNYVSGIPGLQKTHFAYGLNYRAVPSEYSYNRLKAFSSDSIVEDDTREMLRQLNQWRAQFPKDKNPPLIIINSSGGGLRSSLWTFGWMQKADSLSYGGLSKHSFLITGSSGGMVGAAFYREYVYRKNRVDPYALNMKSPLEDLGKDVLNPVGFGMAVNDLFFNFEKVHYAGEVYPRDRGYAFDEKLNENTLDFFNRPLGQYKELESNGLMPRLILAPTVISDGRRLLISPQGLSFLTHVSNPYLKPSPTQYDALEFSRFFKDQGADNLLFTTALRMSATFPYITPLVTLPSNPPIEVIDAGARDNDGFELSLRFVYVFREWIAQNTSGVTFVKLLANKPMDQNLMGTPYSTRLDALIKPVGGIVTSFSNWQGFSENEAAMYSKSWIDFPLRVRTYSLLKGEQELSLSWHLKRSEKQIIQEALNSKRIEEKLIPLVRQIETPHKN